MINEALWQCAPLQHDRLLQLINGVELPALVDSLLQPPPPKWRNPPDLNPAVRWPHVRLNEGDILTPQVRDSVSRSVRRRTGTVLLQGPLVETALCRYVRQQTLSKDMGAVIF